MLHELHIESLGVIDRLDLVLGRGLTALTGETGAGKTMLVEAISLLVGGRADASMVRTGATEARVEGRFVSGDDEVVVARVIPADGRSRAYVNGRLATVANLAELGEWFVDLHGQHAHQRLLTTAEQRDALDRWCRTDLAPLRAARARLTEIDAALAALGGDTRAPVGHGHAHPAADEGGARQGDRRVVRRVAQGVGGQCGDGLHDAVAVAGGHRREIGRASCRERV